VARRSHGVRHMWSILLAVALAASPGTSTTSVDLNRATEVELVALPGIGPAKARAIVAARARRPFRRVTELLRVRGIGPKLLARLRPVVKVEPDRAARPGS